MNYIDELEIFWKIKVRAERVFDIISESIEEPVQFHGISGYDKDTVTLTYEVQNEFRNIEIPIDIFFDDIKLREWLQ